MAIRDGILPEFDHEMATTRRVLERVPEGKLDYKPHETSMPLDRLAGHVTEIPGWIENTIQQDTLEIGSTDPTKQQTSLKMSSRKQLLEEFDKNVAKGRAAIASVSDEELMKPWSLIAYGKPVFTLPKVAVLRGFVMNHMIHHRAQLGVYLRLNGVPVPSIYGPSADENPFAAGEAKSEAAKG